MHQGKFRCILDARADIGSANMPIKPDPLSNPPTRIGPIANGIVYLPTASFSQPLLSASCLSIIQPRKEAWRDTTAERPRTMSEPATKLERDIVFRKLRSKPENKVRSQLSGRWWSHTPHSYRTFVVRLSVSGRAWHWPCGLAALLVNVMPALPSRRVGFDGAYVRYHVRCGPPVPTVQPHASLISTATAAPGAPCRFASTARRRTRRGRPSLTACSSAWRARACIAHSASTSALSGASSLAASAVMRLSVPSALSFSICSRFVAGLSLQGLELECIIKRCAHPCRSTTLDTWTEDQLKVRSQAAT